MARFEDEKEKYPKEVWSIVAKFHEPPNETHRVIADFWFLVEWGPSYLLYPGSKF